MEENKSQVMFGTMTAIKSETPKWAKWLFRIVFALTTAVTAYVAATNLISPEAKYELTLLLKLVIDPLAFTISKMFGVKKEEEDAQ